MHSLPRSKNNKTVIAKRSKKFLPLYAVLFCLLTSLCVVIAVNVKPFDGLFVVATIISAIAALIFLYLILLPKNAIIKLDDNIIIHYLFIKKTLPLSAVTYACHNEKGEWWRRDTFLGLYRFYKDVRLVTVTYTNKQNILSHCYVLVMDGESVSAALNAVIEEYKEKHGNKEIED